MDSLVRKDPMKILGILNFTQAGKLGVCYGNDESRLEVRMKIPQNMT